ncbi:MAG TPA: glucose-6-phosphate dehydrogenase, partial [Acidimicrobiia bacterium]|nr:glucose-6-phosphate dehydrogenase [Acidimicrobiia bacterium]
MSPDPASASGDHVAVSATLVVFGATGDLARRKLYPALASLANGGQLPARLTVVGNSRRPVSDDEFAEDVRAAVEKAGDGDSPGRRRALDRLAVRYRFVSGPVDNP